MDDLKRDSIRLYISDACDELYRAIASMQVEYSKSANYGEKEILARSIRRLDRLIKSMQHELTALEALDRVKRKGNNGNRVLRK